MTGEVVLGEANNKGKEEEDEEELEDPLELVLLLFFRAEDGDMGGDFVDARVVSMVEGLLLLFLASEDETLLLISLLMSLSTKLSDPLLDFGGALGLSGVSCWPVPDVSVIPEEPTSVTGVPEAPGVPVVLGVSVPGVPLPDFLMGESSTSLVISALLPVLLPFGVELVCCPYILALPPLLILPPLAVCLSSLKLPTLVNLLSLGGFTLGPLVPSSMAWSILVLI